MNKNIKAILATGLIAATSIVPVFADTKMVEQEIKGSNRYETAGKIADKLDYNTAVLINGDKSLADGLSASGLAGVLKAPILLTQKDELPKEASDRLNKAKTVYLVGGTTVISEKIEETLKSNGTTVKRIQGKDRFETSYNVAKEMKSLTKIKEVYIANGNKGEADAVSISAVANKNGQPILLTDGKTLESTLSDTTNYVIGGEAMVSKDIENKTHAKRLAGKDRFETNNEVNKQFFKDSKDFIVAKGWTLIDALTTSSLQKPVVLVEKGSNKNILKDATTIIRIGGISEDVYNECLNTLNEDKPNQAPVIKAKNDLVLKVGDNFNSSMLEIQATDDMDGNLTSKVKVYGEVNTSQVGTYYLRLVVSDSHHSETIVKVAVKVIEGEVHNTAPVINSKYEVKIKQGQEFNNSILAMSATDKEDGNLTNQIRVAGNVDTNKPGTYNLTLKVTDARNMTVSKNVVVIVEANAIVVEGWTNPNDEGFKRVVTNEMNRLVNQHRASNGKPALQSSARLEGMANAWSKHMSMNNFFSHTDPSTGKTADQLFPQFGISSGENIAGSGVRNDGDYTKADAIKLANNLFSSWKNSPGHNAAMLRGLYETYGFGFYVQEDAYGNMNVNATQEFGANGSVSKQITMEVKEEQPLTKEEVKEEQPVVKEEQPQVTMESRPTAEMK